MSVYFSYPLITGPFFLSDKYRLSLHAAVSTLLLWAVGWVGYVMMVQDPTGSGIVQGRRVRLSEYLHHELMEFDGSCAGPAVKAIWISPWHCETCRSQWPRGLRRGSAVGRLLGLWVRIPEGAWMSVSCECCVLSGRGLCVGLITRPEVSYRVWCVLSVIVKRWYWGGPGPLAAVAPWERDWWNVIFNLQ
jgi:hypothetical protein